MTIQSPDISPRRLTGAEEAELRAVQARYDAALAAMDHIARERDQLIFDITEAGARVADVSDVLELSRNSVYNAIERAKQR